MTCVRAQGPVVDLVRGRQNRCIRCGRDGRGLRYITGARSAHASTSAAALYREDAERDRAQAVRQFQGMIAQLDERLS